MFTDSDYPARLLVEGGDVADALWQQTAYSLSKDDHLSEWQEHLDFEGALLEWEEHASFSPTYQNEQDVLWSSILDVLNNKKVGKYGFFGLSDRWSDAEMGVQLAAEHLRRARVSLVSNLKARANTLAMEAEVDYFLSQEEEEEAALEKNSMVGVDNRSFRRHALRMVKMALGMRMLKNFKIRNNAALQNLPLETQLFARMSSDAYLSKGERLHLEDPETFSMFWHQKDFFGVAAGDEIGIYYNPAEQGGSVLQTPCVVVAFRGTVVDGEKCAHPTGMFRCLTDMRGDLFTDLKILTGTSISSVRFQEAADTVALVMKRFQGMHVYLTGHSLGGSLAMNALQVHGKKSHFVKATVFNPGMAGEPVYVSLVNSIIKAELTSRFVPFKKFKSEHHDHPYLTKLFTEKIGGKYTGLLGDDPVSMFAGGAGHTNHYEGAGVASFIDGHGIANFPHKLIRGVESINMPIPTPPPP